MNAGQYQEQVAVAEDRFPKKGRGDHTLLQSVDGQCRHAAPARASDSASMIRHSATVPWTHWPIRKNGRNQPTHGDPVERPVPGATSGTGNGKDGRVADGSCWPKAGWRLWAEAAS